MEYTICPKNLWLKKHKPSLFENIELSEFEQEIILNGQIVDQASMLLYPDGEIVPANNTDQLDYSKELVNKRKETIFQASFASRNFFVRTDILHFDKETGSWSLYEVKATNSVKISPYSHIKDLAFQKLVLQSSDVDIKHVGVIHLNSEYRRTGELNYDELFVETDVTTDVQDMESAVDIEMNDMETYLTMPEKPGCGCLYRGRSSHCQTFAYSNPYVPDYSVHNISRIGNSKKRLASWINRDIYSIEDIDNPEILKGYQSFQYLAHINGQAVIDTKEILRILNDLEFPIHFLDYETYSSAIPRFDRFGPWQQIPFQYSIHILNENGSLEHKEYLIKETSKNMTLALVETLKQDVQKSGSVVVWYAPFEKTRNSELANLHPEYAGFLSNINDRIFDLMKIFSDGHYVDPAFRGSNSIKSVLPVLVPNLLYTDLAIQTGTEAPVNWNNMISKELEPAEQNVIEENLLEYCKLDTLAMVRIYEYLKSL
jgi:hypothetical protein